MTRGPDAGGRQPSTLKLTASRELHRLVSGWRRRLVASDMPPLAAMMANGYRQRRQQVSQQEIADLVGVSGKWYGALERGNLEDVRYSDDLLDRVAFALDLSASERQVLYLHAARREPPRLGNPHPPEISRALAASLHTQPWPAWISDPAWNVLVINEAALRWFPHMAWERNVMAWVYKYVGSQHQLVNWETVWAPRMLMQMRAALARYPDHVPLKTVTADILASNTWAQNWWDTHPEVLFHPDGDVRELYLPREDRPTRVEIVATTPMRNPDLRLVMVIPVGGAIPDDCMPWAPVDVSEFGE